MHNIYLIGFMGSGKSTIGNMMDDVFKYECIDLDVEIEKRYQKKISDIIRSRGEKIFRNLESGMLYSVTGSNKVVATGGGIVERQNNVEHMKYNGYIVFLQVSFETIEKRLKNDMSRPLWNTDWKSRKQLFERREYLYEQASDYTIQTNNRTIQSICREIYLKDKRIL